MILSNSPKSSNWTKISKFKKNHCLFLFCQSSLNFGMKETTNELVIWVSRRLPHCRNVRARVKHSWPWGQRPKRIWGHLLANDLFVTKMVSSLYWSLELRDKTFYCQRTHVLRVQSLFWWSPRFLIIVSGATSGGAIVTFFSRVWFYVANELIRDRGACFIHVSQNRVSKLEV